MLPHNVVALGAILALENAIREVKVRPPAPAPAPKPAPIRARRNGLCPCGSGKKFKKCCLERIS